jgi:hypothetical protein
MVDYSQLQTATVSSCPPLASVGTSSSSTQAATAATGRVRSTLASRTARGSSISIWKTTA